MKKLMLFLDTSSVHETRVSLMQNGKNREIVLRGNRFRSEVALPLIVKVLAEWNVSVHDIDGIQVHEGPGSFTGLRVGFAIGNMLAQLLSVPMNGKPPGSGIIPHYK